MENLQENQAFMDSGHVPKEFTVPYDVVELPSQGILYPNKKKSVKVEYLTALDENILSSPNISNSSTILDILINRKVKDLGFEYDKLLTGDRMALLIYLRVTGFGEKYTQMVYDEKSKQMVEGEIDLSKLEQKKLTVNPDSEGLFDYKLPSSGHLLKFKLLNSLDEKIMEERNNSLMERSEDEGISFLPILRLEQSIQSIDGITDKITISNMVKKLNILDIRKFNKYVTEIEPGINFKTTARTPGGASVPCFLKFGSNFFWPEL